MTSYSCTLCNYHTKIKTHYNKHLDTNKHKKKILEQNTCKVIIQEKKSRNEPKKSQNELKINNKEKFTCSYCNKKFITKANMRRHELHRCKNRKLDIENKKYKEALLNNEMLYKKIETLLEENGKVINNYNHTVNHTNIHQTNNIVVNNYGDEDLSHLTQSVMDKLISSPADMINNLTKLIHFNKDKPENMNMYIPNKKQKHIKIFKGNRWTYESKEMHIPDLIDRNYLLLDSHFEDCGGNSRLTQLDNKNYKNYQKLLDDKDFKVVKQETEKCEYEILNNSKDVIDQHNLEY